MLKIKEPRRYQFSARILAGKVSEDTPCWSLEFACSIIIRWRGTLLVRGSLGLDSSLERLGRLSRDEKVAVALDMSDACLCVCAEGIRAQYPGILEEELVEKLRARLEWSKRQRKR
jgi:hypothetical protein